MSNSDTCEQRMKYPCKEWGNMYLQRCPKIRFSTLHNLLKPFLTSFGDWNFGSGISSNSLRETSNLYLFTLLGVLSKWDFYFKSKKAHLPKASMRIISSKNSYHRNDNNLYCEFHLPQPDDGCSLCLTVTDSLFLLFSLFFFCLWYTTEVKVCYLVIYNTRSWFGWEKEI